MTDSALMDKAGTLCSIINSILGNNSEFVGVGTCAWQQYRIMRTLWLHMSHGWLQLKFLYEQARACLCMHVVYLQVFQFKSARVFVIVKHEILVVPSLFGNAKVRDTNSCQDEAR